MTDFTRARDHIEGIQFRAREWAKSGETMPPRELATELLAIGIAMAELLNAIDPPRHIYKGCRRCEGYAQCVCPPKPSNIEKPVAEKSGS